MLDVSDAIKNAYLQSNVPVQLKLVIDGTTYTSRNITAGSVSITESLCSLETFDISSVEKNELEFSLFNETQAISDLVGKTVVASHVMTLDNTTEEIPLGTYTIVTSEYDTDYVIKCVCYDAMLNFDKIIDDWWNTQIQFPITIGNLITQLFQYVGVTSDLPTTYNNSDFVITTRTAFLENTKASELLGQIQEVVGGFFKADRYGVIRLLAPSSTMGLYPRIGLYPRTGLYPASGDIGYGEDSERINYNCRQIFGELTTADYTVQAIDKVQIRGTEEDVGIIIGTGTNTYVIQGNILLYGLTDAQGQTVGQNIYNALSVLTYIPFNGTFKALPYVEVGDFAFVTTREGITAKAPILYRVLNDQKLSIDNFITKGAKDRPVVKDVNKRITVLNQRTHEVINTVEELSSTITNIETEIVGLDTITTTHSTQILQNANEINLIAEKQGQYNLLTNSDFSNQTNRTSGWVTSFIDTAEYVYDEAFMNDETDLENGYCLKLTTSGTGNGYITQVLNYSGRIEKKLTGALSYRIIAKNATNIRPFIHIWAGSTSLVYAYVGTTIEDGKLHSARFILTDAQLTALQGQDITKIEFGYFISEITDTCVIEVNHFYLGFSDTIVPYYFWTNAASNDLISQINIMPTGIKINADKLTVDTSSLDLTFGSQASHVTIEATSGDDGILFDGSGKVQFSTNGQFYVGNMNSYNKLANNLRLDGSSSYPYVRIVNYQKDNNATQYVASSIYLKQTSDINSFDFYNNRKSSNTNLETATANHLAMYSWDTANIIRCVLDNYHTNGNIANQLTLQSSSNSASMSLRNYDSNGTERSGLLFESDGTLKLRTLVNGVTPCGVSASIYGNLDLIAGGNLHLNVNGNVTVQDGNTYYTGAGAGPQNHTLSTGNVSATNWNNTQNVILHFYKGLYIGYHLENK